jgi:hypothetical protein
MAIRWGTWEGIRAQFVAGFTYGLTVLVALLYHLSQGANPVFWVYAAIDLMYLIPITLIFWSVATCLCPAYALPAHIDLSKKQFDSRTC